MSDEIAELRKEINGIRPLVDALQTKLNYQAERIDELEAENERLKKLVDPDPGSVEYEQLTKAQKVRKVREALVDRGAQTHNGRAAMKYKDVMWLFDGQPSAGHCYDLMERAGELEGFAYDAAGGGKGEKRIRVETSAVKDETLFHAVNKAVEA